MGDCQGIKRDKYIRGVHERGCSRGRLALTIRVQRLSNAFEASKTVATMDGGPSVKFYTIDAVKNRLQLQLVKGGEPTSRDKVPPAADLLPHVEEDPILLLGPGGLSDAWVEFLTETLSSLIVRSTRKILGNFMPTVTVLADGLQEQLVFLKCPPPLSERGIEGMDPALAASLVRSAVDEFGNLYPIDLFSGGCNATTMRDTFKGWGRR